MIDTDVVPASPSPSGDAGPYEEPSPAQRLFAPPGLKLALLGITTLGIYCVYWFYRNWLAISRIERRPGIMASWRAALMPLWVFSCFRQLARITGQSTSRAIAGSALLALALAAIACSWFARPPVSSLSLLVCLPMLPVNARLRRFKRAHGVAVSARERWHWWNWLWIATMVPLLLFSIALLVLALWTGWRPPG